MNYSARINIVLFLLAASLVIVIATKSLRAVSHSQQAALDRKASLVVLDTSGRLLSNVKDAETGQRGYILTGQETYLEPYLVAHKKIEEKLSTLRELSKDDLEQMKLLDELQPILDERIDSLVTTVKLVRENKRDEAMQRIISGRGHQLMNQIRALIREFEAMETIKLSERDIRFNDTLSELSLINTFSSMLILIMALLSSLYVYRESRERIQAQEAANKALEKTNQKLSSEISMRKKIEAELSIAATAFESQEGVFVTDENCKILRVNKAFTRITGFAAADVVGENPRILASGKHDKAFYAAMWESIHKEKGWEGEIWNLRKDGSIFPEHLSISAITDANDKIVNYVATITDISERVEAAEKIENLAFYDTLTKLPNRRLLMDRLAQALIRCARADDKGALLFIDLDNFKTLNDTLGHDIGDLLLQQVSERLNACIRESDTVARLGGDEFVVLLEGLGDTPVITAAEQAGVIARKIFDTLNKVYTLGKAKHKRYNSPSIGIALFDANDSSVDELLKHADIAMYRAKADGRNMMRFFDPKMEEIILANASLEMDLREALKHEQLVLFYQAQVTGQKMVGAEALIRWQHPKRGLVPPMEFIPLAEETGLIISIGNWVLQSACEQLAIWQNEPEKQHLSLSINVSARQFHEADFVANVKIITAKYALSNLQRLKLELTESVILDDIDDTIAKMVELRGVGVRFSMDDFGTGYSSLSYLTRLPLDQLKIDQSFVRNLGDNEMDGVMVQTIIAMAKSLALDVIAEGVETEEQRELLDHYGCNSWQGYFFSKPVPLADFENLMN